eukprot:scaffold1640_cov161-Amphora_coffeaeformis.AAC.8
MALSDLFPPLSVQAGLTCLIAQVSFSLLFAYALPAGPWTKLSHLTAHQVVCFPLMIYLTYHGFTAWFTEQNELAAQGMEGRMFGLSPRGHDMCAVVWGMMVFWDIPTSFVVPALQDPLMLIHHLGMCYVSGIGLGLFSDGYPVATYYSTFFFGVVELSSVFLTIVDVFHPKNADWHEWLNTSKTLVGDIARKFNEVSRVLFAVFFLLTRCVGFPYIMATTFLMDFWTAANLPDEERHGASSIALFIVFVLAVAFTGLQLHWGLLVSKQVAKALGVLPDQKKRDKKSK